MIIVVGQAVVHENRLEEALELSLAHVRRSRMEAGCISHSVHQDVENSHRLVFVEEWSEQAALEGHFELAAARDFVRRLVSMAVEAPSMEIYAATPAAVRLPLESGHPPDDARS